MVQHAPRLLHRPIPIKLSLFQLLSVQLLQCLYLLGAVVELCCEDLALHLHLVELLLHLSLPPLNCADLHQIPLLHLCAFLPCLLHNPGLGLFFALRCNHFGLEDFLPLLELSLMGFPER